MSWIKKIKLKYGYAKKAFIKDLMDKIYRLRLNGNTFCILSNNCWGGDIYQALNLPYNTPFVGLFINAPCYIKLLNDLDHYLSQNLKFVEFSKYKSLNASKGYPIGMLDDVEIHFLHYKTNQEVIQKWHRRLKRMPKDKTKWFVKFDDRDNCNRSHIEAFHAMDYLHKVSFTKEKYNQFPDNIKLKHPKDLILLYNTFDIFDFVNWINCGSIKNLPINRFINLVFTYPRKF